MFHDGILFHQLPGEAETDSCGLRVQINIPAESGEMGILANHVPSIEQLKPGLVEIIEESGGSKQFFRTSQNVMLGFLSLEQDSNTIHLDESDDPQLTYTKK